MRRMEQLDLRLRPGEIAERASALFESRGQSSPETVAEEFGKDAPRRAD